MTNGEIAFIDLKTQRDCIREQVDAGIARVLDHGGFIMGPEVALLESQLSTYCGAEHTITCANGTDALSLVLMAENIGPDDAVFVPAFTFVAPAEVALLAGATPVFVDVCEDTFNLDPTSLEAAIEVAKSSGLSPRMVIPVDLFGLPADYDAVTVIAKTHGMTVVADAAQGFGGVYKGRKVGTLADYTTTSFFPAKPLGCYGDGGAVFTDNDDKAALLKSIRFHGRGGDKYDNVRVGVNSRLDTIQAAILIEKLTIFAVELKARDRVASRYTDALGDVVDVPQVAEGSASSWAQYTIKVVARDQLQARLKAAGVPSAVYYPIPLNRQSGYLSHPVAPTGVPVSDALVERVLSLPMHPYLDEATQDRIIENVLKSLA